MKRVDNAPLARECRPTVDAWLAAGMPLDLDS